MHTTNYSVILVASYNVAMSMLYYCISSINTPEVLLFLHLKSMCTSYILNILPLIFPLYLLVTTGIWSMKLSSLYIIICHNTRSCKVTCGTIWGYTTNRIYYYINVVCIQIVLHWGTTWECSIHRGNMVCINFYNMQMG